MELTCKPCSPDVPDEERALAAPYLALLPEDAGQRACPLREASNSLRHIIKTGAPWRLVPHDLSPWAAACQQARRWLASGCSEVLVDDLRAVSRVAPSSPARFFWTAARCAPRRKAEPAPAMTGPSAGKAPNFRLTPMTAPRLGPDQNCAGGD